MNVYVPAANSVLRINYRNSELYVSQRFHSPNLKRKNVTHLFLMGDAFDTEFPLDVGKFLRDRLIGILHVQIVKPETDALTHLLRIKFNAVYVPPYKPFDYMTDRDYPTYIPLVNFAMAHIGKGNLISIGPELLTLRSPLRLINALADNSDDAEDNDETIDPGDTTNE